MDVTSTLAFFSIFLLIGFIIIYIGFRFFKTKHLIENTPTSKIRSLAMGFAEVAGTVLPFNERSVLISPFSNQKCVYYEYFIEEYRSSGKNSSWVTIRHEKEKRPFYIKDDTGKVLVDPTEAQIDLLKKNTYNSSLGKDPPENVKRFLETQNLRFEGILFGINKRMRYIEYLIRPNDRLYIMGTVKDNPYVKDASVTEGVEDMIITKGKNIKLFSIFDREERRIVKKFSFISYAFFLFGGIIIIATLIAIFKTVM